MKRFADAHWAGSGAEGSGHLSTQSGVFKAQPYSFKTRFGDENGTNPEELIAAAHAGCYTMQLSFNLSNAGFVPTTIDTHADLTFADGAIKSIHLTVNAAVPGVELEKFQELAQHAKANCPISKVLNTEITMTATVV
jgi:osmotically inducible protein OsmC